MRTRRAGATVLDVTRVADFTFRHIGYAMRSPRTAIFRAALLTGSHRLLLHLTDAPISFHEKVRYKMIRDRRKVLATFADKASSRTYVASELGDDYVMPTIAILEDAADLQPDQVPREFVIKVSHASGGVVMVDENANRELSLPDPGGPHSRHRIHPDSLDWEALRHVVQAWLKRPYGKRKGEWAYSVIEPRIVVEQLVHGPRGEPPRDVKCFVFHGKCGLVRIDTPHGSTKCLDHFTPDGEYVSVRFGEYSGPLFPQRTPRPVVPDTLPAMVAAAERLGSIVDFVRVDFLELHNGYVVSELTNYPTSGTGRFVPGRFDEELGQFWTVPAEYG